MSSYKEILGSFLLPDDLKNNLLPGLERFTNTRIAVMQSNHFSPLWALPPPSGKSMVVNEVRYPVIAEFHWMTKGAYTTLYVFENSYIVSYNGWYDSVKACSKVPKVVLELIHHEYSDYEEQFLKFMELFYRSPTLFKNYNIDYKTEMAALKKEEEEFEVYRRNSIRNQKRRLNKLSKKKQELEKGRQQLEDELRLLEEEARHLEIQQNELDAKKEKFRDGVKVALRKNS